MKQVAINLCTLWSNIETRLDSQLPKWRGEVHWKALEDRLDGLSWSDDRVFEGILMAVLSSNTVWSRIERVQNELRDLFSGFSLECYAELSDTEIRGRFPPWFKQQKAGSITLARNLVNLAGAARKLLDYSRAHGAADGYFTSLIHRCDGDPKLAALHLALPGEYKLPSLGVPLAAEALKNLGFEVAKPDRHIMRAVGSFGLVDFSNWTPSQDGENGRGAPGQILTGQLLAMKAVQDIAEAADERVVLVDNAIWRLCEKSGLYLSNPQLAVMAR